MDSVANYIINLRQEGNQMGNPVAKRQRRIERAHGLYAACLLVNEMPPRHTRLFSADSYTERSELNFTEEYKARVGKFYLEVCVGINEKGTPPGRKARKRFVRSYCAWVRRQVFEQEQRDAKP